ncbi:bacterial Ig-like domain-containing protein [Clostridium sp. AF32-12BH]|uniref:bacterial Ig-like domain-containing protein n=1 Tax=Clostridium sp. AF32-12BH TaxID=2292006 RepID=UPI0015F9E97B|nr:bacterial Ig-like domain-containing protein [Clostridium sp. AF32-12BH]
MNHFKRNLSTALIVALLAANVSFPSITINAATQSNKATSSNLATDSDWDEDERLDEEMELYNDISLQLVDTEAPIIKEITVDNDISELPGTVNFTVDIEEEDSGLREICVRIESLDSSRYVNKTYKFDAENYSGEYELEYTFTDKTISSGYWQIYAYAADNNYNYSGGFETFNSAKFYINGNTDFEPPTVKDARIVSDKIYAPDDIVVEVEVEDESGIKDISLTLIGEDDHGNQSKVSKTFHFDPDNLQDTYTCSVPIQKTYVSGTYKIGMITVSDGMNNWTDGFIKSEWLEESCEVVNYWRDDYVPPEVTSVVFDAVNGRSPYILNITANVVEEGSGLSSMAIRLFNKDTDQFKWVSFPVNQNGGKSGKYETSAEFTDFDNPGVWVIDCVVINDAVGNDNYYEENFGCSFELLEPVEMIGIYIKNLPTKREYLVGDELNLEGLSVFGQYSDDTERELFVYAKSKFDSSSVGEKEIVITYDVFKTSFAVNVIKSDNMEDNMQDEDIKQPKPDIDDVKVNIPTPKVDIEQQVPSSSSGKSHSSGGSGGGCGSSSSYKTVATQTVNTYPTITMAYTNYIYDGIWQQELDGKWKFISNGEEVKSNWVFQSDKWYLIGSDGYMITGWVQVNGIWYYLFKDGAMARNETFIGEKRYIFADNGALIEN